MQQQEHTDNIFTCHLGNIKPYQSVRVIITYITHLELEEGSKARFVMPQAIAPKYSMTLPWDATHQTNTNTPDNHATTATWNHKHVDKNGNTLSDIAIQITMPSAITDITSPSHDAITCSGGRRSSDTFTCHATHIHPTCHGPPGCITIVL